MPAIYTPVSVERGFGNRAFEAAPDPNRLDEFTDVLKIELKPRRDELDRAQRRLGANQSLFRRLGVPGTPALLYRASSGDLALAGEWPPRRL